MRGFNTLLFVLFALSANAADETVGTVSVQKENNVSVNGEAPLSKNSVTASLSSSPCDWSFTPRDNNNLFNRRHGPWAMPAQTIYHHEDKNFFTGSVIASDTCGIIRCHYLGPCAHTVYHRRPACLWPDLKCRLYLRRWRQRDSRGQGLH